MLELLKRTRGICKRLYSFSHLPCFILGLKKAIKDLSGHFLKDTIFITSEQRPSIADIHGACELMQLKTFDFNLTKLSHKMDFWLQKTRDFVNPHFDEVHEELMSLSKHQHKL